MTKREKLPKAFKKKWITALRSGKYKQGTSCLKHRERYCCLGVACEIAGGHPKDTSYSHSKKLPSLLRGANKTTNLLADMNDGSGGQLRKSFKQIADYIEKNL